MIEWSGAWDEREAVEFLNTVNVPLRLGCLIVSDRPWIVPLWYRFRNGAIQCSTSERADVVRFLREHPDVAFDVSTNDPPYRGVRGAGVASIEPDPEKDVLRDLLDRYLGGRGNPLATRLMEEHRDEVTIEIEPDRVYSWDFTDRMVESPR